MNEYLYKYTIDLDNFDPAILGYWFYENIKRENFTYAMGSTFIFLFKFEEDAALFNLRWGHIIND